MAAKWYNPRTWFGDLEKVGIHNLPHERSWEEKTAGYSFRYHDLGVVSFDGEKTQGNAGPMLDYRPDHYRLTVRAWQMMFESAPAIIGIGRLVKWVISKGLKLQSEPVMEIIKSEGIQLDKDKFAESVESRWNLWRFLTSVDYAGKKNLNELSAEAEKNSLIAGDVLIVLRVIKGQVKVQVIDSFWVQSPLYGSESWPKELPDGHLIVDGVEMNEKREHVAYWVKTIALEYTMQNLLQAFKYERIEAVSKKTGIKMAYLYFGNEFRINTTRGIPILSPFTEKLTNLDLYSTATLKQAQESAKVDYQVVHEKDAKGNAPWAKSTVDALNGQGPGDNSNLPKTDDGEQLYRTTHVTGIGTAYNNSPGSEIKMLENKNPLYYKDFNETHRDEVFAGISLPPNVAMSKYNDSFSASRAAVMDWGHTVICNREHHKTGCQKPVFDLWLHIEILSGRIQAAGYLLAWKEGNIMLLESYRNIRLVGSNVPHIDPMKEANAVRVKMGEGADHLPIGNMERVTEDLDMGDFNENIERFSQELQKADKLGIKPASPEPAGPSDGKKADPKKPAKKKPTP